MVRLCQLFDQYINQVEIFYYSLSIQLSVLIVNPNCPRKGVIREGEYSYWVSIPFLPTSIRVQHNSKGIIRVQGLFYFILRTHRGSHKEVYRDFQSSLTSSTGDAKTIDHMFRVLPAYTAQLLSLHCHRANNQYRKANQVQPTLRVSSSTQATVGQSPIQVLTELNIA